MAPVKRNAPTEAAEPKKKTKTMSELKLDSVTCALTNEMWMPDDLPKPVLEMLVQGVPHATSAFAEERHSMQTKFLGHIYEIFAGASAKLEMCKSAAQQGVDANAVEVEAITGKVNAALTEVEAAQAAVEAQKTKIGEELEALGAADTEAKGAASEHKANLRDQAVHQKEHDKYTTMEKDGLNALLEGTIQNEKELKKISTKFLKDMEKLGADDSLLTSAPSVLLKKPEERKGFDDMVIGSLRSALETRISTVNVALESATAKSKESDAVLESKNSVVESCSTTLEQSKEELVKLETTLSDKTEFHHQQEDAGKTFVAEQSLKVKAVEDADMEITLLGEAKGNLDSLSTQAQEITEEPAAGSTEPVPMEA